MNRLKISFFLALPLVIVLAGCSGTNSTKSEEPNNSSTAVPDIYEAPANKDDYPVFADPDAGADPAVSAEQGGKGFSGAGWETNTGFELVGSPKAVKGGLYRNYISDFPGTLRMGGPEWNTYVNYMIGYMVYETLLDLDRTTLDYIPRLATHWQISADKMTFRFRINPSARFSDGQPVTSDDVVASLGLYADKTLRDPSLYTIFAGFEKPVVESKYIVQVKSKSLDWKNFLNFATQLRIFPAKDLKGVDGAKYVEQFNFKYLPGSGPYMVNPADIIKGKSVSVRRRADYWAAKNRSNVGLNNFDEVRLVVVRDENLVFEMFKKGDLDFYYVNRSKIWVQEMDFDKVQRGLIQKRKVFNHQPQPMAGFAMNTRVKPFDDIRVRKALTLMFDRAKLIEKVFFNEYVPENSYFPMSIYENPNNPKNLYDPEEALKLLAEAGWKDRDSQGRITKDGQPLMVELLYTGKTAEPYLTVYQEDLRKVGISLNLRLVTFETQFKLTNADRKFEMASQAWGLPIFPDPVVEWHSRLADQKDNNNITGFKDPRLDEIMDKYGRSFDLKERVALIQELDSVITNLYHYILQWTAPAERIAYWNKFGHPAGYFTRTGNYMGDLNNGPGIEQLWWVDPEKSGKLEKAMADPSLKLDVGQTENRYWQEYARKEDLKQGETKQSK